MSEITLLAIDPGNVESAWMRYDGASILGFGKMDNKLLLRHFTEVPGHTADHLAIETLFVRGMPTSQEELNTQLWAGRFIQAIGLPYTQVRRLDEKLCICGSVRAKDGNIRQALIDRWGGTSAITPERKCSKCNGKGWAGRGRPTCDVCGGDGHGTPAGPLAGISADVWQALAISVTWFEMHYPKLKSA